MPKKKKIETEVDEITNSTNPSLKVEFNPGISELSLDLGRDDLNQLVDKVNQIIKKVNK